MGGSSNFSHNEYLRYEFPKKACKNANCWLHAKYCYLGDLSAEVNNQLFMTAFLPLKFALNDQL